MTNVKHSALLVLAATAALGFSGSAFALKPGCEAPPCGGGGGNKPPIGETGANNLSFPVILSDNATPASFPVDGAWRWAEITDPSTQCIGEEGVLPGEPVPPEYMCYYGRHVTVSNEEGSVGEILFDGDTKVWWLQKRTQNFWKALSVGHDVSTPLVVSAVDVGDLLESTPEIQPRQIRVEFNLLQSVDPSDPELGGFVGLGNCTVPPTAADNYSIGCFAALGMSGAVPGTEQSGQETQGTDFGPGGAVAFPGTQVLLDPTTVRPATTQDGTSIPIQALVYSNCARLVIQKVPDSTSPVWDQTTGVWSGPSVGAPLVNVAAYTGAWSTEVTSGGSIVYGYNWNAKTASTGLYRLTMVLDGNDAVGPVCSSTLATKFESPTETTAGTQLVNVAENYQPHIIDAGDSALGDEGGLVYIDIPLTTKGGGGGGGGGGNPNR